MVRETKRIYNCNFFEYDCLKYVLYGLLCNTLGNSSDHFKHISVVHQNILTVFNVGNFYFIQKQRTEEDGNK